MADLELTTAIDEESETVAIISQQLNGLIEPETVVMNAAQLREALELVTGVPWSPGIGEIEY